MEMYQIYAIQLAIYSGLGFISILSYITLWNYFDIKYKREQEQEDLKKHLKSLSKKDRSRIELFKQSII